MSLPTPQYPGVDPDANRGPTINAVGIIFLCFTAVVLALRFFSRVWTNIAIAIDDWLIVVAAVFSWTFTILCLRAVQHDHYGQHVGKASLQDVENFAEILYFMAITYCPALTLAKISLLALYWRIFRVTTARRPLQIVAALNVGWGIAAVIVCIFPCIPVQAFWDSSVKNAKCINYNIFYTSNEAIAIVLDLLVIFMPVYFVSNLQQSLSHRVSISSTFLLGLIVTIVQGLRLWRLVLAQRLPKPDPTFNEVDAGLWAIAELNLWVIVASIPALRPLVNKVIRDRGSQLTSSPSQRYGYSRKSSAGIPDAKPGFMAKHFKLQSISNNDDVGDQSALKQEAGVVSGAWSKTKNKYDVQVSAPAQRENRWTPLGTDRGVQRDMELGNLAHIRVDSEVEVVRPQTAFRLN